MRKDGVWVPRQYKIQYLGSSGYTQECLLAIDAILNSGCLPEKATIVSTPKHERIDGRLDHLFIFWNWHYFPLVIIPSGFASGYSGEGSKGFSLTICMIREKGILIDSVFLDESEFSSIDRGEIQDVNHPIYTKIKLNSEPIDWAWPDWILDKHALLLSRGQIWREFRWRKQKTDWLSNAIGALDILVSEDVGRKLRLALKKLNESEQKEEWQTVGILVRDAWIEMTQELCNQKKIDTSDIEADKVVDRLIKLKINTKDEKLFNLAKAAFNLSFKTYHDRNIGRFIARACLVSTIASMYAILVKEAS